MTLEHKKRIPTKTVSQTGTNLERKVVHLKMNESVIHTTRKKMARIICPASPNGCSLSATGWEG
jgi:hypothetical protein